jgi:hypothetical protein
MAFCFFAKLGIVLVHKDDGIGAFYHGPHVFFREGISRRVVGQAEEDILIFSGTCESTAKSESLA